MYTIYTVYIYCIHSDFGFTDTILQRFSSYLTDRTQYICVSNHCSAFIAVYSGVSQGSVLSPIIFSILLSLCLPLLTHTITHHSFADDLQLHMSAPDKISELLHSVQSCTSDVKGWGTENMLKLNNMSELMLVTSKELGISIAYLFQSLLAMPKFPSNCLKNLEFTLDCHLTMNAHVYNIARTCCFELRLFVNSWHVQRLPCSYQLLFCQQLTTVAHCCLILLMM